MKLATVRTNAGRMIRNYGSLVCLGIMTSSCAHVGAGIGLSIPIGPFGSLGVNLGSDGRVGGSVGVGYGGASVSVGTSGQLPAAKAPEQEGKQ